MRHFRGGFITYAPDGHMAVQFGRAASVWRVPLCTQPAAFFTQHAQANDPQAHTLDSIGSKPRVQAIKASAEPAGD